jgi:hypothetical protein
VKLVLDNDRGTGIQASSPRIKYGAGSAKAGNQRYMKLDSCFHRKLWIPACVGMTTKEREAVRSTRSRPVFGTPRLQCEGGFRYLEVRTKPREIT